MPDLLVRDLKPETVACLEQRALRKGVSLQAEVQALLDAEAERERAAERAFWAEVYAFRDSLKAPGRTFSDSGELIREDRDER
jgi:plasmid stability protein